MDFKHSKLGLVFQGISLAALAVFSLNVMVATQPARSRAACLQGVGEFDDVPQPDRSVFAPVPREFFPPWQIYQHDQTDAGLRRKLKPVQRESLTERMWQDSLYGQSSSDGETIFVVSSPGFSDPAEFDFEVLERDWVEPIARKEFNELRAVSVGRSGAFKWEVGGLTGLNESRLAKTFFLSAPLPLEGALYAVCQQDQQIKLVVLDPETGRLLWSQQLVSVEQSVNVVDDPLRRLGGASPSFADGMLVCATGAGAIVAVDLSSRTLSWGYQFMSPSGKNVSRISPDQDSSGLELSGIWRESTIVIAEGCVLHTPADSQNMICVDLQTGYPKWKSADKLFGQLPRGDSLFLACAEFGNVVLVGRRSVRAVRLSDGFPVWELTTETYGRPSGRGYTNQGFYYLPMTSEQLLQIDLKTGSLVEIVPTDGVLGNLICHRDAVISHGAAQVAAYWQHQPATERIRDAEESGGMTPELLALKSQLEYQSGNLRESATLMAAAYDRTNHAPYAMALSELVIELVESDYEYGIALANRYENAMIFEKRREFEAARIDGYGNSIVKLLARQDSSANRRASPYQYAEIRIVGNLVLLNVGVELFGMDWLKLRRGENGLLWNISAKRGETDQSSTAPAKIWGERPMIERRSAYETKIFVSPPSAQGICYLDGNQLICVDPYSGEICWQRANFQPRSMLYGTDDLVVVWNQHDRNLEVFEIATGWQVKQLTLDAKLGALWTNQGHRLLLSRVVQLEPEKDTENDFRIEPKQRAEQSYHPFDGPADQPEFNEDSARIRQSVGLYDLLEEKFVWDHEYPLKTVACRMEGRRLAVLLPSGELEFVDLATGKRSASGKFGLTDSERQHVQQIGFSSGDGVYLLHLQSAKTRSDRIDRDGELISIRGADYYDWLWRGHLPAIDRETLMPQWKQAVRVEHFQVAKSIPYYLPFYVLVRRYDRGTDSEDEKFTQFILIDVESGQLILNQTIPFEYQNNNFRFQWEPNQNRLRLNFVKHHLLIDFAHDDDVSPRPVASLTSESTIPLKLESAQKTTSDAKAVARELESLKQLAIAAEGRLESERAAEAKALSQEKSLERD